MLLRITRLMENRLVWTTKGTKILISHCFKHKFVLNQSEQNIQWTIFTSSDNSFIDLYFHYVKMYIMYEYKTFLQSKSFWWIIKVYSKIALKSYPCFYVKVTEFIRHYEDTKTTITMLKLLQTTCYYHLNTVLYH